VPFRVAIDRVWLVSIRFMAGRKKLVRWSSPLVLAIAILFQGCSSTGSNGGGTTGNPPPAPSGLTATAGSGHVSLSWSASRGATSYNVLRSTTSGGPYSQAGASTTTSYVDSSVTNGTTYYYVVTAVNDSGQSGDSNEASATPTGSFSGVSVNIDVLANRHTISPYIYGGSYP